MTKKHYITLSFLGLMVFLFAFLYSKHRQTIPFKCIYSTNYYFGDKHTSENYHVTHDLRIYSKDSGYLLIDGEVTYNGNNWRVSRTFFLNNGIFIQDKTYRYSIVKTIKDLQDNIPEDIAAQLLHEYEISPQILQIDIFPLANKTYLIGGPFSFLSVCLRY